MSIRILLANIRLAGAADGMSDQYTDKSPQVEWLFKELLQYSAEEISLFLKFVTGLDRMPYMGRQFKILIFKVADAPQGIVSRTYT